MARRLRRCARHLGTARAPGRLYDLGPYPGITAPRRRGEWVAGDLYELRSPRALLRVLDLYEAGAAGRERPRFVRVRAAVLLADGRRRSAWLYLYRPPVRAQHADSVRRLRPSSRRQLPARSELITALVRCGTVESLSSRASYVRSRRTATLAILVKCALRGSLRLRGAPLLNQAADASKSWCLHRQTHAPEHRPPVMKTRVGKRGRLATVAKRRHAAESRAVASSPASARKLEWPSRPTTTG